MFRLFVTTLACRENAVSVRTDILKFGSKEEAEKVFIVLNKTITDMHGYLRREVVQLY